MPDVMLAAFAPACQVIDALPCVRVPGSILPTLKNRGQNVFKAVQLQQAMSGGLLGRSRRPPIRGHASSVPRHGFRGVGCLKQLPKPVCQ